MDRHAVRFLPEVDGDKTPTKAEFTPIFNVAVPFIDRHLKEGRSEKPAIKTSAGRSVTYRELADNVNRCGNLLSSWGLKAGDRAAMVIKDCPEFFFVFWGAIKAGIIPVPINTLLRAKDYAFIFRDSGCRAVVYSPEYEGEVRPALSRLQHSPSFCVLTEGDGESLQEQLKRSSPELEPAETQSGDDCFIAYSSGSTGNPKGVVHRHESMVLTSQMYGVHTLGIREEDICFSAAKLFFVYGGGNAMQFPLWVGASTILFDGRPTPKSTFDVIEKLHPTLYFGVPTLYAAQLQALQATELDVSSIRACVSAGEGLPADILERWKAKTGLTILDGIGSTELLHIFISNRPTDVRPGSTGRIVPGYRAKIVNKEEQEVPIGESGELWVAGGSASKRYWNNPEKTNQTMKGRWLNTGDTFSRDEAGYYYYCGRNDDMLKVGGIWTSPFEIEARLIEHPRVLEAAVVDHADKHGLIKPKAFIVLTDAAAGGGELDEELLQHCKKGLAPYKYPRWFVYLDELPKTATGKIQRFRLRKTA